MTPSGLHSLWFDWHLPKAKLLGLRDDAAAGPARLTEGLFWPAVEVALAVHYPNERTIREQREWLQQARSAAPGTGGRRHA